jgi:hypothetical protein
MRDGGLFFARIGPAFELELCAQRQRAGMRSGLKKVT